MNYYIKRNITWFFKNFFLITTGTLAATAVFTTFFLGIDYKIPVSIFWQILLLSFMFTIPNCFFISFKELSKKQFAFRYVFHFFYLLIMGVCMALWFGWISFSNYASILFFIVLFCLVYAFVILTVNYRDKKTATKLNNSLKNFQKTQDK